MPFYFVIAKRKGSNMRWLCEHLSGGPAVFVMRHHAIDYIDHNRATGIEYEVIRTLAEVIYDSAGAEGDES